MNAKGFHIFRYSIAFIGNNHSKKFPIILLIVEYSDITRKLHNRYQHFHLFVSLAQNVQFCY